MNRFKFLLMLSLSIFLLSCSKDDDGKDSEFTALSMKQTSWKGKIIRESDGVTTEGRISILFTTDKRGSYELKEKGDAYASYDYFDYNIDDKLVRLTQSGGSESPRLYGDWLLISKTKDKLILVMGINTESFLKTTLELTRVY